MAKKTIENNVTRKHFDECTNAFIAYGFEVANVLGSGGNDGVVLSNDSTYVELWDNTDNKCANLAIRPTYALVTDRGINLQWLNTLDGVRVTTPKNHQTARIAVYSESALDKVWAYLSKRFKPSDKAVTDKANEKVG